MGENGGWHIGRSSASTCNHRRSMSIDLNKPTKRQGQKLLPVRVSTVDSDFDFRLEENALGGHLFDLVSRIMGIREIWYFGLQFRNCKGFLLWLKMREKVFKQKIATIQNAEGEKCAYLWFIAKFHPEVVESELIQDITKNLFYLQTKQHILLSNIECAPELAILLATYALQAERGDFEDCPPETEIAVKDLLPAHVMRQYEKHANLWEGKIRDWWHTNRGLSRTESQIEYLKVAQDLNMYGVHYFEITNKTKTPCWLGVHAHGIGIYAQEDKQEPITTFKWSEIRNISYKNKKFTIATEDADAILVFYTKDILISQTILDLCLGSHNLYLQRRQPDSMEIQHMRAQAKFDKEQRLIQRNKLELERQMRLDAERKHDALRMQLDIEMKRREAAEENIERAQEMATLMAEKAKIGEEEALMLAKRAADAEAEMQRVRYAAIQAEELRLHKVREPDEQQYLLPSTDFYNNNRPIISHEFNAQTMSPLEATWMLSQMELNEPKFSASLDALNNVENAVTLNEHIPNQHSTTVLNDTSLTGISITQHNDDVVAMQALSAEIERERVNYANKSKILQEQLSELRNEIQGLKTENGTGALTSLDKQSTLRKTQAGTPKARVQKVDRI